MKRTLKNAACVLACLFLPGLLLNADAPQVPSGTWAPAGSMTQARVGAAATLLLLPDCRVLITGGDAGTGPSTSAELYDPSIDSFTAAAPMPVARTRHVSILLQDGRVLVAGGSNLQSAEVYDPSEDTWTSVGNMNPERSR